MASPAAIMPTRLSMVTMPAPRTGAAMALLATITIASAPPIGIHALNLNGPWSAPPSYIPYLPFSTITISVSMIMDIRPTAMDMKVALTADPAYSFSVPFSATWDAHENPHNTDSIMYMIRLPPFAPPAFSVRSLPAGMLTSAIPASTSAPPAILFMSTGICADPKSPKLSIRSPVIVWPKHRSMTFRALPSFGRQIILRKTMKVPHVPPSHIQKGCSAILPTGIYSDFSITSMATAIITAAQMKLYIEVI